MSNKAQRLHVTTNYAEPPCVYTPKKISSKIDYFITRI